MIKMTLSAFIACLLFTSIVSTGALAKNVPFDGAGAGKTGKTGWTAWQRSKVGGYVTRQSCYRAYYKNGQYQYQENKLVWFWQPC